VRNEGDRMNMTIPPAGDPDCNDQMRDGLLPSYQLSGLAQELTGTAVYLASEVAIL
jgi:hypothetical protein